MIGTVKRVVRDKGFAFVRADSEAIDRFAHMSALRGGATFEQVTEGARVEFQPVEGPKGPRAEDVFVL